MEPQTVWNKTMSDRESLRLYGMVKVADMRIASNTLVISVTDLTTAALPNCVYALLIGDKIRRIGSSKAVLRQRLRSMELHISNRWQGRNSPAPPDEADLWREFLEKAGGGEVHARQGTSMTTPVGEFPAYLDEESVLIGRHRPALNRSMHR